VREALQARNRFGEVFGCTRPCPLRDRLSEIAARVQTDVEECWLIAKRGPALVKAQRGIDGADVKRELAEVIGTQRFAGPPGPSLAWAARSLDAQQASAGRLYRVVRQVDTELGMLHTRPDGALVRTLERSPDAADATSESIGSDVDTLLTKIAPQRQALEETSRTASCTMATSGAAA
jgi:hypothetical protein